MRVTALLDASHPDDAHVRERLRVEPIVWLTTVTDGSPRSVPVWFHWSDPAIVVFADPGSQKVRHLRANSAVSISLDTAGYGSDVVTARGDAALTTLDDVSGLIDAFGTKYAVMLGGRTIENWIGEFAQPIRITLSRLIAWQATAHGVRYRSLPAEPGRP